MSNRGMREPRKLERRETRRWFRRMMALAGFRKYEDFAEATEDIGEPIAATSVSGWFYVDKRTGRAGIPRPEHVQAIVDVFQDAANRLEATKPDAAAELRKVTLAEVHRQFGLIEAKNGQAEMPVLSEADKQALEHLAFIEKHDPERAQAIRERLENLRREYEARQDDEHPKASGGLVNPALS